MYAMGREAGDGRQREWGETKRGRG